MLKNKVTGLEIVAHYSDNYNYGLSTGESCYSVIVEYNRIEYVVCINKDYQSIYRTAERLTEDIDFPLAVNRVTKLRGNNYTNIFERYMISDLDNELCENMDFNNTTRDWNSQTDK